MTSIAQDHARRAAPGRYALLGPLFVVVMSAGALGTAFVSQWEFGLLPCVLCVWQRWAYGAALGLGVLALAAHRRALARRLLLGLAALAFVAVAGIAFYHVGVEQGWWQGSDTCQGAGITTSMTRDDIKFAILNAPTVSCNDVPWSLWGLSIAAFNVIFSLVFAAATAVFALKGR